MVPLFFTEVWPGRINQSLSPLERQLVVLQSKLVPPVIGSKKQEKKKKSKKKKETETETEEEEGEGEGEGEKEEEDDDTEGY